MRDVAILLIEDERDRVVLQLRDDIPGLVHANMWSFFGGRVEHGETPAQAALRELSEELTVPAEPARLSYMRSLPFGDDILLHLFHYRIGDELRDAVIAEGQAFGVFLRDEVANVIEGRELSDVARDVLAQFWREADARPVCAAV
jgi:8-oxo-dGTP pyrophosphatase MutT (NUDIX family)